MARLCATAVCDGAYNDQYREIPLLAPQLRTHGTTISVRPHIGRRIGPIGREHVRAARNGQMDARGMAMETSWMGWRGAIAPFLCPIRSILDKLDPIRR